jgi:ADP-heptose:LPS heptosyltransferase
MSALDVISVDTAVAHVAGASGRQCLLLVPDFGTDWRWMRNRDDSPWYPYHKIYRSAAEGDWSEAIDRLAAEAWRLHDARG